MRRMMFAVVLAAPVLGWAGPASAFDCPSRFDTAQAAIDDAMTAMNAMGDATAKGLVHTLIDDAKMLLESARHNHEKPAAGGLDHARSMAKAGSAASYANAANTLVSQ